MKTLSINLPAPYLQFRDSVNTINMGSLADNYEPEMVALNLIPLDELEIKEEKLHRSNEDQVEGYYQVKCVELTEIKGALVWFPQWSAFGCLDAGHGEIFVCQAVEWADIANNPSKYLAGKWEWDEGADYRLDPIQEKCKFVPYE